MNAIATNKLKLGFDLDNVILFYFFIPKLVKDILITLREDDHEIKIVTSRGNFVALWHAKIMLKIYGLGWLQIVGVGRNGEKHQELDGFHMFIDDKVKHLIAINGKVKYLYIFGSNLQSGFLNLENWWQIYWEVQWILAEQKKELAV